MGRTALHLLILIGTLTLLGFYFQSETRGQTISSTQSEIRRCAEKARLTARETSHYLSVPVTNCEELGLTPEFIPLAAWGYFNPFGPTAVTLFLIGVPESKEQLIFLRILHPLSPAGIVYGIIPNHIAGNTQKLFEILQNLFARNDSADQPVISSLPSHVIIIPESPLRKDQVKELLFISAKNFTTLEDLDVNSDRMDQYKGDPWRRTMVVLKEGLKRSDATSTTKRKSGLPTRASFERWWNIVSNPEHVQSETSQMKAAWKGAIEIIRRSRK